MEQQTKIPAINLNPFYRGRVRSGCNECRAGKVKCDEQRPRCRRCSHSDKVCIYKTRGTRAIPVDPPRRMTPIETSSTPKQSTSGRRAAGSVQGLIDDVRSTTSSLPNERCNDDKVRDETDALSHMISQDIRLCTTIDWLAAKDASHHVSFSYFRDKIDLPLLTPFDPCDWKWMKKWAVELAKHHDTVAAALAALQLLFRAQANDLPTTHALSQYRNAKKIFDDTMPGIAADFEVAMLNVFVLTLISSVLVEDFESPLDQPNGPLVDMLEVWSLSKRKSSVASRIASWLIIMHAAARRGGNQGLLSAKVHQLLSERSRHDVFNPFTTGTTEDTASAPVFTFYLDLQRLSLEAANLSHYHRSRISATDQKEVMQLMADLTSRLNLLWQSRPSIMRAQQSELTSHTRLLTTMLALSQAAFYAEQLDVGRSLSESLWPTTSAENAMTQIRALVESSLSQVLPPTDNSSRTQLSPGFLRPLFMCAIESAHPELSRWAVSRMREVKDPICRSDFFANFAEAIVREQERSGRRITTRWLCYRVYGMPPPIL